MLPNAYTKKEILDNLASRGHFIDSYTLDSFFEQSQIESIFEDEQGQEFFDKSVLDIVCEKLFKNNQNQTGNQPIAQGIGNSLTQNVKPIQFVPNQPQQVQSQVYENNYSMPQQAINPQPYQQNIQPQIQPAMQQFPNNSPNMQMPYGNQQPYQNMPYQQNMQMQQPYMQQYNSYPNNPYPSMQIPQQNIQQNTWKQGSPKINLGDEFSIDDPQTSQVLRGISLSNGTPLMDRLKAETGLKDYTKSNSSDDLSDEEILKPLASEKPKGSGILDGAMEDLNLDNNPAQKDLEAQSQETPDFDDISLLSESMEAQEKFRQYVVSELAKKNMDVTPQSNEFKLDISERTINMIARTVAKKIAKNVTAILTSENKNSPQGLKEENEKLAKKTKELEEENKKLRLLLVESNKNLNSFKPSFLSIFGFYRRVKPTANPKNNKQEAPSKAKPDPKAEAKPKK